MNKRLVIHLFDPSCFRGTLFSYILKPCVFTLGNVSLWWIERLTLFPFRPSLSKIEIRNIAFSDRSKTDHLELLNGTSFVVTQWVLALLIAIRIGEDGL